MADEDQAGVVEAGGGVDKVPAGAASAGAGDGGAGEEQAGAVEGEASAGVLSPGGAVEGAVTAGELRKSLAGQEVSTGSQEGGVAGSGPGEAEGHPDPLDGFEPVHDDGWPIVSDFHAALAGWHKEIDELFAPFVGTFASPVVPSHVIKHALVRTINFLMQGLLDRPAPTDPVEVGGDPNVPHAVTATSSDDVPHAENAVVHQGDHVSFDVGTTAPEASETMPQPEHDPAGV